MRETRNELLPKKIAEKLAIEMMSRQKAIREMTAKGWDMAQGDGTGYVLWKRAQFFCFGRRTGKHVALIASSTSSWSELIRQVERDFKRLRLANLTHVAWWTRGGRS